jgi:hypothetical protein
MMPCWQGPGKIRVPPSAVAGTRIMAMR